MVAILDSLMRSLRENKRKMMVISIVIAVTLIALSVNGCGSLKPPTATPTSTATETRADSPTTEVPTDTPAYTPTVAFIATIIVDEVDVHEGPGIAYPVISTINEPISVRVIGINEGKTWFFILLP